MAALIAQLPSLRRYATALTGNAALADDLVQDGIERALRQADQLRELERLPSWLRRIVHNRYIDELRRNRSMGIQEDIMDLADDADLSIGPTDSAGAHDFLRAMNSLTSDHRQILLLVGLEDLSYQEIASELDIPIGTVMSRLARARERLRQALQEGPRPMPYPALRKKDS